MPSNSSSCWAFVFLRRECEGTAVGLALQPRRRTTTLAPEARGILAVSPDETTILFHRLEPEVIAPYDVYQWVDVASVNHLTQTPPTLLVATSTVIDSIAMNAAGTHFIASTRDCGRYQAFPLAGGSPTALGGSHFGPYGIFPVAGTGAVSNPGCPMGCAPLEHVDLSSGAWSRIAGADDVPVAVMHKNRLFFAGTSTVPGNSGVFMTAIP
jgi:hypothetical protein